MYVIISESLQKDDTLRGKSKVNHLLLKLNHNHLISESEGLIHIYLMFNNSFYLFVFFKIFISINPVFHRKGKESTKLLTGEFSFKDVSSLDFCHKTSFPDFTSLAKALCLQLPASKLLH